MVVNKCEDQINARGIQLYLPEPQTKNHETYAYMGRNPRIGAHRFFTWTLSSWNDGRKMGSVDFLPLNWRNNLLSAKS